MKPEEKQDTIQKDKNALSYVKHLLYDQGWSEADAIEALQEDGKTKQEAEFHVKAVVDSEKSAMPVVTKNFIFCGLYVLAAFIGSLMDNNKVYWGALIIGSIHFFISAAELEKSENK